MKTQRIFTILFFVVVVLGLVLGLRGIPGNPTSDTFADSKWNEKGPLELSPDRGRFALLYSVVEDHSVKFSLPVARFATPDLGISPAGEYVSLFAPGVSFVAIPGYVIGKLFGASQVGSFAVVALFALLNAVLVRAIAKYLGAREYAADLGALAFLFASPAFAYAVTLYQHHISTFLILLSVYTLLRWNNQWSLVLTWLCIGFSLSVDYPNFFLMLPIGVWALCRIIWIQKDKSGVRFTMMPARTITLLVFVIPMIFFFWFNSVSNGGPLQLSGTLRQVEAIDAAGLPAQSQLAQSLGIAAPAATHTKTAIGFFKTRNLLNGFYMHFISPDRGMITFTPVMLFGVFGFWYIYKKNRAVGNVLLGIIGFDVLLYSMWGDPYGGWAFGSRYLIPSYALLGIAIALLLERWRKQYVVLLVFLLLFGWSVRINTLGAITSSSNPPQIEVLTLEKSSGRPEKYSYDRNEQYLAMYGSKSFLFNAVAYRYISAQTYFFIITGLLLLTGLCIGGAFMFDTSREKLYE
jgi:hypothetical protein